MNLPFEIARRYLFAKKSHNAINIISLISIIGVCIVTAAFIIVLSVMNGFSELLGGMYNSFDPEIKITPTEGKVIEANDPELQKILTLEEIEAFTGVVEEKALLKYNDKQTTATIKGVSETFSKTSGIDTMMVDGNFVLHHEEDDFGVIGMGLAMDLGVGLTFVNPLVIYAPRRFGKISLTNPERSFNRDYLHPSGIFSINQPDYDFQYMIIPLERAQSLFEYENQYTGVEIKIRKEANIEKVQDRMKEIGGEKFIIKNQKEQHELFYRMMKIEKWMVYLILTFILFIATFNIIGSMSMLILDKRNDIITLRNMGANNQLIRRIFLVEGWMISLSGALIGLVLGAFICWLQMEFGLIQLQGSGQFIIDAYPVKLEGKDFFFTAATVVTIGIFATGYPVHIMMKRYLQEIR